MLFVILETLEIRILITFPYDNISILSNGTGNGTKSSSICALTHSYLCAKIVLQDHSCCCPNLTPDGPSHRPQTPDYHVQMQNEIGPNMREKFFQGSKGCQKTESNIWLSLSTVQLLDSLANIGVSKQMHVPAGINSLSTRRSCTNRPKEVVLPFTAFTCASTTSWRLG